MSASSGLSTEAIETWFCEEIEAKKFLSVHTTGERIVGVLRCSGRWSRAGLLLWPPGTFDDVASCGPVPYVTDELTVGLTAGAGNAGGLQVPPQTLCAARLLAWIV